MSMQEAAGLDIEAYFSLVERNAFIPEPPKQRIYTGDADFRKIGCGIVKALIRNVDLQPHSAVLDIGSGVGRVALPLTQWLDSAGRYVGVEIVTEGVSWCIENISAKYPNFYFIIETCKTTSTIPRARGHRPTSACQASPGHLTSPFSRQSSLTSTDLIRMLGSAMSPRRSVLADACGAHGSLWTMKRSSAVAKESRRSGSLRGDGDILADA